MFHFVAHIFPTLVNKINLNRKISCFVILFLAVIICLSPLDTLLSSTPSTEYQVDGSSSISHMDVQAGDSVTIKGHIPKEGEINIVIASKRHFSPKQAASRERAHLIEDGQTYGFREDTSIPYLYYILTSEPSVYGDIVDKDFGGAFFFKGLYKTTMFELKTWKDIKEKAKVLGPIDTENQWDFFRYAHEEPFGINTINKEKISIGNVTIFSRSVVSDYEKNPYPWNKGVHIDLDQEQGKFEVEFKTFSHTAPDTEFVVYVNGEKIGTYVVHSNGLWLPLGWRYVNPFLVVLGAIIAGTFYSMIGASGGLLMAAFQITFIGTAGPLGINAANVIKPSNLALMFSAAPAALYRYWLKERRLAFPAALIFAGGVSIGAFGIGPPLSATYLNMEAFKPWLAVLVLIMAIRTLYELTPRGMRARESVKGVTRKFEEEVAMAKKEGREREIGRIETLKLSLKNYRFSFWGEKFSLNIPLLISTGALIGTVSAAFGVGGGFLIVPTLTILGALPMYVVVPISLFSAIAEAITGIGRYAIMGYPPDLFIVLFIIIGGGAGGMIGSRLQPRLSEKTLKIILAIVLFFLVFRFAGIEIWI